MHTTGGSDGSQRVKALLAAALERRVEQRAAFLNDACHDNPELRSRVEALLAAQEEATELSDADECTVIDHEGIYEIDETVGQKIGRYTLLEKLGEGGFGSVWAAEQTEPVRRQVALKVIKLGMDTRQVIARFEAERQALAMMDHPGIAQVFDAGTTDSGRPYFVMELVKGMPITKYCQQERLSTKDRLELFVKVCQAVQHAHQKGIIHRDIKPPNILVTVHDSVPQPKVIDFGIAKATEQDLTEMSIQTQIGQFIGTPAYMSPEQADPTSTDIDTRSDLYSLGVLLYELLTGVAPFDWKELMAAGFDAIRRTIREKDPPRPSTKLSQTLTARNLQASTVDGSAVEGLESSTRRLLEELRGDLDWIVMKCLEKDRARRYESATDLASDIRRHLENEPVMARPPSTAYKIRKAWRRNRFVFTAGSLVAISMVVGVVVSVWQARIAIEAQRREAKLNEQLLEQVDETEKARRAETEQRRLVEGAIQKMQLQKTEELFSSGQTMEAMQYLGDVLQANPSNAVASARLVSAVARPFVTLAAAPMGHSGGVNTVEFSPDGSRLLTANSGNYFVNEGEEEGHAARIWDVQTGLPLTPPMLHGNQVVFAEFSPDGSRVATASSDDTCRIWDALTGLPVTEPLQHRRDVVSARFSPDGSRVVTASADGTARVWAARTGEPLTDPLEHGEGVWTADFSPDGFLIISSAPGSGGRPGTGGMVRVWEAQSGALLRTLPHPQQVRFASFSPDGTKIVTACDDGFARLWELSSGTQLVEPLEHDGVVGAAVFSPDGSRVVTASVDHTARIWDVLTGQPVTAPLKHRRGVRSARFSPDGLLVVTASEDTTTRIWDAFSGQPVSEAMHHGGWVNSAVFSPEGRRVATASSDGRARIWNARAVAPIETRFAHPSGVKFARFSPDGRRVLTSDFNQRVVVWEVSNEVSPIAVIPLNDQAIHAEFSPDGSRIVTASFALSAQVWSAETGQSLSNPMRHNELVSCASFSPDGRFIATASWDATARIWNAQTGQPVTEPLQHGDIDGVPINAAVFSPDGALMVTGCGDTFVRIWDVGRGQLARAPLKLDGSVDVVEFSPDGSRLLTATSSGTANIWDVQTLQPLTSPMKNGGQIRSAEFSPDGRLVVVASEDQSARIWDTTSGVLRVEPLTHEGPLTAARFSSDGARVVTASEDRTVKVWDVESGRPLMDLFIHDGMVQTAEFSPDGSRVLTASLDGTARLWDAPPPVTPVPNWFLQWAETRTGTPLTTSFNASEIPYREFQQRRKTAANQSEDDLFTRTVRWAEADPEDRLISPFGTTAVSELISRLTSSAGLVGLRELLRLNPSDASLWLRLADLLGQQAVTDYPAAPRQAIWSARMAVQCEPNWPEGWLMLGRRQQFDGQFNAALESVSRALELAPGDAGTWALKGQLLAQERQWRDALDAYQQALSLRPQTSATPNRSRGVLLLRCAEVLRELGEMVETADQLKEAHRELGIPARDAKTQTELLDLSPWYNAGLNGSWHVEDENYGLAELPHGIHEIDGIPFDLRGVVQLAGKEALRFDYPDGRSGLGVHRKFRWLHVLHATGWTESLGTTIAVLRLHFTDGRVRELPIRYGEEVLDWVSWAPKVGAMSNGRKAWEGLAGPGFKVRLFRSTWENPFPDVEISSVDYRSTGTTCAPFLIAITTE